MVLFWENRLGRHGELCAGPRSDTPSPRSHLLAPEHGFSRTVQAGPVPDRSVGGLIGLATQEAIPHADEQAAGSERSPANALFAPFLLAVYPLAAPAENTFLVGRFQVYPATHAIHAVPPLNR